MTCALGFGKTQRSMRANNQSMTYRWVALFQMALLLPSTLAGSICFRDGKPAALEFGCVCTDVSATSAMVVISLPSAPDCAPCRDVVITATVSHRVTLVGMHLADGVEQSAGRLKMEQLSAHPYMPSHSRDPHGRPLAVLRC